MWYSLILCALLLSGNLWAQAQTGIYTIFGWEEQPCSLVVDLLHSPTLQRLQSVDQNGIARYYHNLPSLSRYAHVEGVYILLRRYNARQKEWVAGLLHYATEPSLSKITDPLFLSSSTYANFAGHLSPIQSIVSIQVPLKESYALQREYLQDQGLDVLLSRYAMNLSEVSGSDIAFAMLEQPLPDISLSRLETHLHTAYLLEQISLGEIEQIINALYFYEGRWIFSDSTMARRVGDLSLDLTQNLWAKPSLVIAQYWIERAIQRALAIQLLTPNQVHFETDYTLLSRLERSTDSYIITCLQRCRQPLEWCYPIQPQDQGLHLIGSFEGIDPWVWAQNTFVRLSALDPSYAQELQRVHQLVNQGVHVAPFSTYQ